MGIVLTQIASMHALGFRHFKIYRGRTGPVAVLLYPRTQVPFGPWDGHIRRY